MVEIAGDLSPKAVEPWHYAHYWAWLTIMRRLIERGDDPPRVLAESCHRRRMTFLALFRLNDVHGLYPHEGQYGSFRRDHPEWVFAEKSMDYAVPQVRQHVLSVVQELVDRYDIDGIDFDFMRAPRYFRDGQIESGTPLMTDMIRQVRRILDEAGDVNGSRRILCVRVPMTVSGSTGAGLDVPTWIRGGLVDLVVPMSSGYLDMTADVEVFVALAKRTSCKVAGGLEYYVRGYMKPDQRGITQASIQMLRAAAASFWERGVDAIYLFNYDCHGPFPFRGEKRQALNEIHDPTRLAGTDQRYLVTTEMNRELPAGTGYKQLPRELKTPGGSSTFILFVGDDVPTTGEKKDPRRCRLLLRTSLPGTAAAKMAFHFNGTALQPTLRQGGLFVFDDPPARRGRNTLIVTLTSRPPAKPGHVRLAEVELLIQRDLPDLEKNKE